VQTSLLQAQIFHAGFPGRALADEKTFAKQAGKTIRPAFRTGVCQDLGRLHQYCHHGRADLERGAQAIGAPELVTNPELRYAPRHAPRTVTRSTPRSASSPKESTDTWGQGAQRRRRALRPIYSIDQMFEDDQVNISASPDVPNAENRHIRLVGQPVTLSRTPKQDGGAAAGVRRQTDEVLAEFGFTADENRSAEAGQVV